MTHVSLVTKASFPKRLVPATKIWIEEITAAGLTTKTYQQRIGQELPISHFKLDPADKTMNVVDAMILIAGPRNIMNERERLLALDDMWSTLHSEFFEPSELRVMVRLNLDQDRWKSDGVLVFKSPLRGNMSAAVERATLRVLDRQFVTTTPIASGQ